MEARETSGNVLKNVERDCSEGLGDIQEEFLEEVSGSAAPVLRLLLWGCAVSKGSLCSWD